MSASEVRVFITKLSEADSDPVIPGMPPTYHRAETWIFSESSEVLGHNVLRMIPREGKTVVSQAVDVLPEVWSLLYEGVEFFPQEEVFDKTSEEMSSFAQGLKDNAGHFPGLPEAKSFRAGNRTQEVVGFWTSNQPPSKRLEVDTLRLPEGVEVVRFSAC